MQYSIIIGLLSFFSFAIMDTTNKLFLTNPTLNFVSYFSYVKISSLILICILGFIISKRFLYVINIKWTIIKTVLLTINTFATTLSVKYLPLSTFAVFVSSIPILTSVLSSIILKDKFTKYHLLALLTCFIGVIIIFSPNLNNDDYLLGMFIASFTVITASTSAIIIRKYLVYENATGSSFYSLLLASILGIALSLLGDNNNSLNVPDSYALICIFISALATIIGKILYMKAFQLTSPVKVAYLQYTHVLWSFLFGFLLFDEVFNIAILIGYILITGSSIFMIKLNVYYRDNNS